MMRPSDHLLRVERGDAGLPSRARSPDPPLEIGWRNGRAGISPGSVIKPFAGHGVLLPDETLAQGRGSVEMKTGDDDASGPASGLAALEQARRLAYLVLGFVLLGLGIAGAFLPVMPTTVFLILAAFCFGRSSPRLETWLLEHPRFGPSLQAWREEGAIPTRAKALAVTGMTFGYGLFFLAAHPGPMAMLGVAAFMLAGAAYVLSRPRPGWPDRPQGS